MGKLEDAATWLVFYVIRPAVQKVIDKFNASYRIFAEIAYLRIHVFLHWIATSNISIFTWVKNEIADAIEEIEDDDGGWFGWIWDIVDAVFDAIEDIFVKVSKLSNKVLTIIADWWETTRDLFLSTLKDTFVAVVDFGTAVIEKVVEAGYETFSVIVTHVAGAIEIALDFIGDTTVKFLQFLKDTGTALGDFIIEAADAVVDWISDAFTIFLDFINDLEKTVAEFVFDNIDLAINVLTEKIPEVVGSMFEWAKPVIDPIIAAAGWLESLTDVFTAKAEDDPELKADIDTIQTKRDEINEVIGRIP